MQNGYKRVNAMNPCITVIVPVYNVKDYLPQCIESVLQQTWRNFELLLIDDGSTDGSADICNLYAEEDLRIRCVHKENGGVSSARNRGLDEAKGEYISFLDSDDYFDPDMLEYLFGLIELTGADYAKCPARLVNWPLAEAQEYPESDYKVYSREEAVKNTLIGRLGFTGSACHHLFKKTILNGVRFLPARSNEDLDFITRVSMQAGNVVVTRCSKYNYVFHPFGGHATPLLQFMSELEMVYQGLSEKIELEIPEMKSYLDVRYVRNALDALNREMQKTNDAKDSFIQDTRRKIISKPISREYLNKTEKLLWTSLKMGLGAFRLAGKFEKYYKERRRGKENG